MNARSVRRIALGGGLGAAILLATAGFGTAAIAADSGVDIAGFAFSPQTITVAVGDTVTWSNADAQSHTATGDGGTFDTGTIAGGSSKSVTFESAGTFAYHCKIHSAMTATIVVTDATGTAPATDTLPVGAAGSAGSDGRGAIAFLAL